MAEKENEEILEEELCEEEAPKEAESQADAASIAEEKAKAAEDKYLRLFAEFDNFKKRSQREKDARYADAVIDTVNELLTVADNLERALAVEVTNEEAVKVKEGVEMVYKQLCDSFSKLGVTEIKALSEQFDPNLHEAVMHIEDETVDDNTVVEEFRKGYIYNNSRVVRHSMVKVAN